jgi:AcrR family transcriptional regulator
MPQRKRRPRTTPDFAAIEELTANLLAAHGESGLRIEELQRATGVSKSSLYGKYGGRDGLVAAGLMVLYERHYRETIGVIDEVVRTSQSRDELMERFRQLTHYVADLKRTTERLHRAAVLAGTIARPELRAKVVALAVSTLPEFEASPNRVTRLEYSRTSFLHLPSDVSSLRSTTICRLMSSSNGRTPEWRCSDHSSSLTEIRQRAAARAATKFAITLAARSARPTGGGPIGKRASPTSSPR